MCHETLAAPPEPPLCFLPDDHPFRHLSPTPAHIHYENPHADIHRDRKEQTGWGISQWVDLGIIDVVLNT